MNPSKIAVISLDHWNYDKHIVTKLKSRGIESIHINFGDFKHFSFRDRILNMFSKIFLKKNIKKIKRQEYIIETLKKIGKQDQILVINPELIDRKFHLEIKNHTTRYIAYLYDSVHRYPVEHLLDGVFDTVFSFDNEDVKKFNFKQTTNYIHLEKKPLNKASFIKQECFYIGTLDNRLNLLNKIAYKLNELKITFQFIIIRKKTWKEKLFSKTINEIQENGVLFQSKRINQNEIGKYYDQTNVIFDLVRENQTGLSFRIFEAMSYQKKIITSNKSIINYDFYNTNNILLVNDNNLNIDINFFNKPYQPIPEEIYTKYTLDSWIDTVFELNK